MKLISLNVWGGAINKPLLEFLGSNSHTDFFLFQEMHHNATEKTNWGNRGNPNLFEDIKKVLPNHIGYFAPAESDEYGLAGFVKKNIDIVETGDVFVHRHRNAMNDMDATNLGRNLQYFKIDTNGETFTLMNFHGLWTGGGKNDTEDRLKQSRRIVEFTDSLSGDFILAGDFNLLPQTESMKILEGINVRNLIKEYDITNTRTSYYTKPEKFADYIFVTPGINLKDFRILPNEVSDHAPVYLEFE